VRILLRIVRRGGGSALPGLLLSKLAPGILPNTLRSFPDGLIVVTGSAGKSTTTKMLVAIARAHGKVVFTNPSTANISQGFYASIIEQAGLLGTVEADVAILEMDEGHAELFTRGFAPRQVTILNVMEDQLDRFVDPQLVRESLAKVANRATRAVILNADDQNTIIIGKSVLASTTWFGISKELLAQEKHGLSNAKTFLGIEARPQPRLEVIDRADQKVVAADTELGEIAFELPNRGLHFVVDSAAALESARAYLQDSYSPQLAAQVLNSLPPVFARGQVTQVNGEDIEFILVQNPGSTQLNLDNLYNSPEQIMLAIGRDVHDPSWMWTVDYSNLSHVDVVTGYNAFEASLVLAYNEVPVGRTTDNLEDGLEYFLAMPKPSRGVKTVIFSADAMRRVRRTLGFSGPEEEQS